jgi:hypothetical protein
LNTARVRIESLRKSGLIKLIFIIVLGHAGATGNKRTDRLAQLANGQAKDRADILNAIRKADSFSACESETMSRLKEHQVERCVAKFEHFSESQRRMVNQHRTGVVSRYMLRDFSKMTSEH